MFGKFGCKNTSNFVSVDSLSTKIVNKLKKSFNCKRLTRMITYSNKRKFAANYFLAQRNG